MQKIIVYSATRNLYKYLPMAIGSVFEYNPDATVLVIAEDSYIDSLEDKRIKVINYNNISEYLDPNGPNFGGHFTYMTLVRLCLSKFIMNSRVLWLDVDTLVMDSLDELFEMDMTNKAVASVMEPKNLHMNGEVRPYINSGVSLFNLDYIREHKLDDKMIEMVNTVKSPYPDQDVINCICKGRIKYLHPKFNISPSTTNLFKPVILHFTFRKIWDDPYVKLWQKFYKERI